MLELQEVSKTYRSIPAVENVSFTLRPGEILGYLGPNGSGKSTTVKMIIGLIKPPAERSCTKGETFAMTSRRIGRNWAMCRKRHR
jgi:ABC-2 type transport system ATP-binding protein